MSKAVFRPTTSNPRSSARSPEPEHAAERDCLGIGVVGVGYWGPRLIRNFNASGKARVVAVCDSDPGRLESVLQRDPSLLGFGAIEDLLECSAVDAVAISTPVRSHHALAKKVLESGRSVLIEKPMAASLAEAEQLVELAQSRRLTLLVDHTFLYHPAVLKMNEVVADGTLGRLLYFDSVRINLGLFQPDINVLWDLAPHDLSILTSLRSDLPETICATGASHWGKGTESIAYLTLRYADDFLAHIHVGWLAPVKVRQTILSGDRRMLIYDDNQVLEKVKIYDRGIVETQKGRDDHARRVDYREGDMFAPHIPQHEALAAEVQDFIRCVRNGEQPVSDGECGLLVVRMLDRAQASMELGGVPVAFDTGAALSTGSPR